MVLLTERLLRIIFKYQISCFYDKCKYIKCYDSWVICHDILHFCTAFYVKKSANIYIHKCKNIYVKLKIKRFLFLKLKCNLYNNNNE